MSGAPLKCRQLYPGSVITTDWNNSHQGHDRWIHMTGLQAGAIRAIFQDKDQKPIPGMKHFRWRFQNWAYICEISYKNVDQLVLSQLNSGHSKVELWVPVFYCRIWGILHLLWNPGHPPAGSGQGSWFSPVHSCSCADMQLAIATCHYMNEWMVHFTVHQQLLRFFLNSNDLILV